MEHIRTGKPICYTSADSVFQIAAHEEVVPLEELYRVCEEARAMLVPPHEVSRVIARPFRGTAGHFERTPNRHDYSVAPGPGLTLHALRAAGVHVETIGKIYDLYAGAGIDATRKSRSNTEGMRLLAERYATLPDPAFLMLNLVDFDMLWGHRNDPEGMARGLVEFDGWLAGFLAQLAPDDLLLLTADHGNDPTTPSTDHSREYVPILITGKPVWHQVHIGVRETFADLAATIADILGVKPPPQGVSFKPMIMA